MMTMPIQSRRFETDSGLVGLILLLRANRSRESLTLRVASPPSQIR
jgi:hypothetical protein